MGGMMNSLSPQQQAQLQNLPPQQRQLFMMQQQQQLMRSASQGQMNPMMAQQRMAQAGAMGQGGMGMGMNPMLQMQMNMGTPFANPHAMQSVMRNPSPGPMPVGAQNFMNLNGMQGF